MRRAALTGLLAAAFAAGIAHAATGPPAGTVSARVFVNPLSVAVLVPAQPVKAGRDFRIRAEVGNAGPVPVFAVPVTLVAPSGLVLRDPATTSLARIDAGGTRVARWDVCARAAGGYVVLAQAGAGTSAVESLAEVVEIDRAVKRPDC